MKNISFNIFNVIRSFNTLKSKTSVPVFSSTPLPMRQSNFLVKLSELSLELAFGYGLKIGCTIIKNYKIRTDKEILSEV